jgi:hypothetical protein
LSSNSVDEPDEKRRLGLVEDVLIDLQADLAMAGCPPSYFAAFDQLQHEGSLKGYEKLVVLPKYVYDHGVKKAICIRCSVTREDVDGHLLVMLYAPPKNKEFAYICFVCPGCSHDKLIKEVFDLCVYAREEMESRE